MCVSKVSLLTCRFLFIAFRLLFKEPCQLFFSNTLSLALCARLFLSSSSCVAVTGLRVITLPFGYLPQTQTGKSFGQMQGSSAVRNALFTILSSSEWKVMMQSLPPGLR